jgi:hypothetical protein
VGWAVPWAVLQPSPDPTPVIWLDSPPNLTSADSTRHHQMDGEHQPMDLVFESQSTSCQFWLRRVRQVETHPSQAAR